MKFPRNAKIFRGQLDVAPFAAVFFLLAILMIFSSMLITSPGVRIDLPNLRGTPLQASVTPVLGVAVDAQGKIYFESRLTNRKELRARLWLAVRRLTNAPPSLVIQADRSAEVETVLQVCRIASEVGITHTIWASRLSPFQEDRSVRGPKATRP